MTFGFDPGSRNSPSPVTHPVGLNPLRGPRRWRAFRESRRRRRYARPDGPLFFGRRYDSAWGVGLRSFLPGHLAVRSYVLVALTGVAP